MKFWIIILVLIRYATAKNLLQEKNVGEDPTPIVLWHGMGDTCCVAYSVGGYKYMLEKTIPGVYIVSIKVGNSTFEDLYNSYFMDTNTQIEYACKTLEDDPKLKNGFNAIGFSQGGQFLRAVIQRCGHKIGRVKTLITLGSQHQGVYGTPYCGALIVKSCGHIRELIEKAPYEVWVQQDIVLATYWHDPLHEEEYKNSSIFLSDINNELYINQTYVDNLNRLDHFVMVMFNNDTITQPKESSWFGFYRPGQDKVLQTMEESDLYKEDRIGLKKMNGDGKLVFLSTPGDHLRVSKQWFIKNIVKVYLSPQ